MSLPLCREMVCQTDQKKPTLSWAIAFSCIACIFDFETAPFVLATKLLISFSNSTASFGIWSAILLLLILQFFWRPVSGSMAACWDALCCSPVKKRGASPLSKIFLLEMAQAMTKPWASENLDFIELSLFVPIPYYRSHMHMGWHSRPGTLRALRPIEA